MFSLTLAAICLDYILVPSLNTVVPVVSCGMLLFFLLRHRATDSLQAQGNADVGSRVLLFFSLHLAAVGIIWASHGMIEQAAAEDSLPNIGSVAAKYLVLAPTIVLLPMAGWRRFHRLYRAELVAAAIALFTLFPYRVFAASWPWYSQALGHAAHVFALPFVSGLQYISSPSPVLTGPKLDVTILFWCSGLEAVKLFQIFFVVMLLVDWPTINRRRALAGYFLGLALMLAANVVRISLLVIVGNRVPEFTVHHHITAGWIFFALILVVYILATHRWLMAHPGNPNPNSGASAIQSSPSTS